MRSKQIILICDKIMKIITEEMRFLRRLCEYALKNGVTRAARRYQTNRQFVYRQLKKYDGDVRSLVLKSRRPQNNPNAYNEEEPKIFIYNKSIPNIDLEISFGMLFDFLDLEYSPSYFKIILPLAT